MTLTRPWVKIQIVPPVNIPIPTKIASNMGGAIPHNDTIGFDPQPLSGTALLRTGRCWFSEINVCHRPTPSCRRFDSDWFCTLGEKENPGLTVPLPPGIPEQPHCSLSEILFMPMQYNKLFESPAATDQALSESKPRSPGSALLISSCDIMTCPKDPTATVSHAGLPCLETSNR